jgi:hypothetical protein
MIVNLTCKGAPFAWQEEHSLGVWAASWLDSNGVDASPGPPLMHIAQTPSCSLSKPMTKMTPSNSADFVVTTAFPRDIAPASTRPPA